MEQLYKMAFGSRQMQFNAMLSKPYIYKVIYILYGINHMVEASPEMSNKAKCNSMLKKLNRLPHDSQL